MIMSNVKSFTRELSKLRLSYDGSKFSSNEELISHVADLSLKYTHQQSENGRIHVVIHKFHNRINVIYFIILNADSTASVFKIGKKEDVLIISSPMLIVFLSSSGEKKYYLVFSIAKYGRIIVSLDKVNLYKRFENDKLHYCLTTNEYLCFNTDNKPEIIELFEKIVKPSGE